jgi:hypothetical protein
MEKGIVKLLRAAVAMSRTTWTLWLEVEELRNQASLALPMSWR